MMAKNINKMGGGKLKEVDDINMQIFNMNDDNINDIDFDDRANVLDDRFVTRKKIINFS
jgi:hypothetical protein